MRESTLFIELIFLIAFFYYFTFFFFIASRVLRVNESKNDKVRVHYDVIDFVRMQRIIYGAQRNSRWPLSGGHSIPNVPRPRVCIYTKLCT